MWRALSIVLVGALALSGIGFAQKGLVGEKPDPNEKLSVPQNLQIVPVNVGPRDPSQYVPYSDFYPASGGTVTLDVSNTPSYDGRGASCNIRRVVEAPAGKAAWTGIGWGVQLTAFSPSWLSEIAVLVTNVNGEGYVLRPGAGDSSAGTRSYSSNGVNDLCNVYSLPPIPLPDGRLYLEFFETFDDFRNCGQDGNWDSGTLTFAFGNVPPFTGYEEQGDAGELPETAQATPSGALTAIRGTLGAADTDVYAIYITDPAAFSASTLAPQGVCIPGQATFDTQLFLFDANGRGVVHNDDTGGGVLSRIDNSTGCIPGPGLYYLAITRFNRDPIGCEDERIWNDTPYGAIRCPDGPEANSRVKSWVGEPSAGGSYIIFLSGAQGANPGDPDDCPPSPYQPWDETSNGGGDAGDLVNTAQIVHSSTATPCETLVSPIMGTNDANDVDLFVICITDPARFVATTVGGATWDTQLWLFRCDGTGVVFNDDSGGFQSRIDNSTNCIQQPGIYILGISRYNRDAVDANGQLIWNNTPFGTIRCPDGPGANNPLAGWTGETASGGAYTIRLRGAYFVRPSGCQEPACPGDANNDGRVNNADLLIVLFNFGQSGFGLPGDVNNDGTVNNADLLIVLFNFGCGG